MNCSITGRLLAMAAALAAVPAAQAEACDSRYAASPQFAAAECRFQNPPNPDLKPNRGTWDIWSRFFFESKQGTVPVDPIPVRKLDRAAASLAEFRERHEMTYAARATWLTMAEADVALFRGQLPQALALSSELIAQARAHRLDRVHLMFSYFGEQQARALAQQLLAAPTRNGVRKQLERWIRRFRGSKEPLLQALADTHGALLSELDGDQAAAHRHWEAAVRGYEIADTPARAAAARMRLATYRPDGDALVEASMAYFDREQIAGWPRVVELFAPSVRPLPRPLPQQRAR